jgi:hypothetical protein
MSLEASSRVWFCRDPTDYGDQFVHLMAIYKVTITRDNFHSLPPCDDDRLKSIVSDEEIIDGFEYTGYKYGVILPSETYRYSKEMRQESAVEIKVSLNPCTINGFTIKFPKGVKIFDHNLLELAILHNGWFMEKKYQETVIKGELCATAKHDDCLKLFKDTTALVVYEHDQNWDDDCLANLKASGVTVSVKKKKKKKKKKSKSKIFRMWARQTKKAKQ